MQGGGPREATRSACADRLLLSRGRAPLSQLPDKHHENSAAHTVIAAPAAGRVSTSPFPRGESESEISPLPSSLRHPPAAAPALVTPTWDSLPGPPTARCLRPVAPSAPPGPAALPPFICGHSFSPRRSSQPCQPLRTPQRSRRPRAPPPPLVLRHHLNPRCSF